MNLKKCRYCGKEVMSLANHIVRMHPAVIEQIEEVPQQQVINTPVSPILPAQNVKIGDISTLIRDKLDIMLNIKIIEMLSNSKDMNLADIQKAISPPTKTTIEELREYREFLKTENPPYIETGNQWVDIAQQAIPIIKKMVPQKKKQTEVDLNVREGNRETGNILKPLSIKVAGNTTESRSTIQESGTPSNSE